MTTKIREAVPITIPSAVNANFTLLLEKVSYAKARISPSAMWRRPVGANVVVGIVRLDATSSRLTWAGHGWEVKAHANDALFNATHLQVLIFVWARQQLHWLLKHNPVHPVLLFQTPKIGDLKILPPSLSICLLDPSLCQLREHRDDTRVLHTIREHGPFGQRAEPVLVFSGNRHVVGVESKISFQRSVVAYPKKRLDPRIARSAARKFNLGCIRKQLPASIKHATAQWDEQCQPAPDALQNKLASRRRQTNSSVLR